MTAPAASTAAADPERTGAHGCCHDPERQALTGQSCQPGQDCPSSVLYTTPDSAPARHAPVAGAAPAWAEPRAPDRVSVSIWRPPASR